MFDARSFRHCLTSHRWHLLLLVIMALIGPRPALAIECEQTGPIRLNVLLVIDNSTASLNPVPVALYDSTELYSGGYLPWAIYLQDQQGNFSPKAEVLSNFSAELENLSCPPVEVRQLLLISGMYASNGTAERPNLRGGSCTSTPKGEVYALGNYLNYRHGIAGGGTITGQQYFNYIAREVVRASRLFVTYGIMVIGQNGKGGEIAFPISNLSDDASFAEFLAHLPGSGSPLAAKTLINPTTLPLAETLVDADAYFRGVPLPVSGQTAPAPPETVMAGNNIVILLGTDLPRGENAALLATLVGDADQDGAHEESYGQGTAYLDDAASALYQGPNRVKTSTLLLTSELDQLFYVAAINDHGEHLSAGNAIEEILSSVLLAISPVCPEEPQPLP
jgi:hypothetical protein